MVHGRAGTWFIHEAITTLTLMCTWNNTGECEQSRIRSSHHVVHKRRFLGPCAFWTQQSAIVRNTNILTSRTYLHLKPYRAIFLPLISIQCKVSVCGAWERWMRWRHPHTQLSFTAGVYASCIMFCSQNNVKIRYLKAIRLLRSSIFICDTFVHNIHWKTKLLPFNIRIPT